MEILDAQVHMWLSDRPSRPWKEGFREEQARRLLPGLIHAGLSMGPDTLLLEMAEAGVDGGVLSPIGVYGADNSFEIEAARRYPRKFCVFGWIDHMASTAAATLEADVAQGMVGVRILALREQDRHERREFDHLLAACERLRCAVSLTLSHPIPKGILDVIARYEGIDFLIDNVGVGLAPPMTGLAPADPFVNLPAILQLARYPNVSMKLTGAPALSHQAFPFRDIWPDIHRIVDAFSPQRVMWGSDFTRTSALHNYWDGTHYLSEVGFDTETLEWLYGRTLRTVLKWDPPANSRPSAATTDPAKSFRSA
jgi:predicted TIM-barrel fold metal-dependent hydrolase